MKDKLIKAMNDAYFVARNIESIINEHFNDDAEVPAKTIDPIAAIRAKLANSDDSDDRCNATTGDAAGCLKNIVKNWAWTDTTVEDLLAVDPSLLLEADILTAENHPLDFTAAQEVGGVLWEPFNVGASEDRPYGDYMTHYAAADSLGDRLPSDAELVALHDAGYTFGIYHGVAGLVFGGKVFFPLAGSRNNSSGALYNTGTSGLYWGSSPSGASARYLYFYAGSVYPASTNARSYGFTVRCVGGNKQQNGTASTFDNLLDAHGHHRIDW